MPRRDAIPGAALGAFDGEVTSAGLAGSIGFSATAGGGGVAVFGGALIGEIGGEFATIGASGCTLTVGRRVTLSLAVMTGGDPVTVGLRDGSTAGVMTGGGPVTVGFRDGSTAGGEPVNVGRLNESP